LADEADVGARPVQASGQVLLEVGLRDEHAGAGLAAVVPEVVFVVLLRRVLRSISSISIFRPKFTNQKNSTQSGVDFMITIFCDFCQFSTEKIAAFSKIIVMIKFCII
jgi:hypothetical protein